MAKRRAVYLHEEQRDFIQQRTRSWLWRYELPTWAVIIAVYGGWFATLANWQTLGLWPATIILSTTICLACPGMDCARSICVTDRLTANVIADFWFGAIVNGCDAFCLHRWT